MFTIFKAALYTCLTFAERSFGNTFFVVLDFYSCTTCTKMNDFCSWPIPHFIYLFIHVFIPIKLCISRENWLFSHWLKAPGMRDSIETIQLFKSHVLKSKTTVSNR